MMEETEKTETPKLDNIRCNHDLRGDKRPTVYCLELKGHDGLHCNLQTGPYGTYWNDFREEFNYSERNDLRAIAGYPIAGYPRQACCEKPPYLGLWPCPLRIGHTDDHFFPKNKPIFNDAEKTAFCLLEPVTPVTIVDPFYCSASPTDIRYFPCALRRGHTGDHMFPLLEDRRVPLSTVDHPKHYTFGKYEVIDVIEDWRLEYHLGNCVKYIARSKHKGAELEDLKKARWYLDRYISKLEGEKK